MVFLKTFSDESLTLNILPVTDYISAKITEEINGTFVLDLVVPLSDFYRNQIEIGSKILADYTPYEKDPISKRRQTFYVSAMSIDNRGESIKVTAPHVSTLLRDYYCSNFSATNDTDFANKISLRSSRGNPFTIHSDINKSYTYQQKKKKPRNIRDVLFSRNEPSFLTTYGGEAEINSYDIFFHPRRGAKRGVRAIYGKNLEKISFKNSSSTCITSIYPFYESSDGYLELPEKTIVVPGLPPFHALDSEKIVDFTSYFDEKPTESQLRNEATRWARENINTYESKQIDLAFADPEIETRIGDDIEVRWSDANVLSELRIIKTVYDCRENRYTDLILGHRVPDLPGTILKLSKG